MAWYVNCFQHIFYNCYIFLPICFQETSGKTTQTLIKLSYPQAESQEQRNWCYSWSPDITENDGSENAVKTALTDTELNQSILLYIGWKVTFKSSGALLMRTYYWRVFYFEQAYWIIGRIKYKWNKEQTCLEIIFTAWWLSLIFSSKNFLLLPVGQYPYKGCRLKTQIAFWLDI